MVAGVRVMRPKGKAVTEGVMVTWVVTSTTVNCPEPTGGVSVRVTSETRIVFMTDVVKV